MVLQHDNLHYNVAALFKGLKYFQCKSLEFGKPRVLRVWAYHNLQNAALVRGLFSPPE